MVTKDDTKAIECRSPSGISDPSSSPTCCAKPKYLATCVCVPRRGQKTGERLTHNRIHWADTRQQPTCPVCTGHVAKPTASMHLVSAQELLPCSEARRRLFFFYYASPFLCPWSASRRGTGGSSQLLPGATMKTRRKGGGSLSCHAFSAVSAHLSYRSVTHVGVGGR